MKQDYFRRDPVDIIDIWLFRDRMSYTNHALLLFNDTPMPFVCLKTIKANRKSVFDRFSGVRHGGRMSSEIIFEVTEAEEGGYCATALGHGITTQAETLEELRAMVRDAVNCFFDDPQRAPKLIRLHFVRDEVLAR